MSLANPAGEIPDSPRPGHISTARSAVSSGAEALKSIQERRYDLALMDCEMPGMDGFATTREIRRRESPGRHIPIVVLTARALPEDAARAAAAGMDAYLTKPIERDDLYATVAETLASAKSSDRSRSD